MSISALRKVFGSAVVPTAVAGALVVTLAGGLATTHHETTNRVGLVAASFADNGRSYDLTTGDHQAFADQYDGIINFIRQRLQATPLYGNILLTRNTDDYFPLTLRMGASRSVTLVINTRNLYVVGFRDDGQNRYYRLNEGPANLNDSTVVNLPWLNYNDMESAAGTARGNLPISMPSIQGAISDISNPNGSNQNRARALLILTQAFAEGARFDFFSYRISQAARNGTVFYPAQTSTISSNGSNAGNSNIEVSGLDFENNWQGLSNAASSSTQNHTSPHYRLGDGFIDTMSALDAQLAVALRS